MRLRELGLVICFGALVTIEPSVFAAAPAPQLLVRLPIVDASEIHEYMATNHELDVVTMLTFTNKNSRSLDYLCTNLIQRFTSYADCRESIARNTLTVINKLNQSGDMDPTQPIAVSHFVGPSGTKFFNFYIAGEVDTLPELTVELLRNLPILSEQISLYVPGLTEYSFVVLRPSGLYTNYWSRELGHFLYPDIDQFTSGEFIWLDPSDLGESCWARFTIGTSTSSRTYTQEGEQIKPPQLYFGTNPNKIILEVAFGSDALLQSSTDLVNWTDLMYYFGFPSCSSFEWSVEAWQDHEYFRALAY